MSVFRDLRHAVRLLRHSPAFSVVAVATSALAIGANTAMFSFVNGLLLRPLPYPDAARIVRVLERHPNGGLNGISTLNYVDWAKQSASFEYIAAEAGWRATVTGRSEPFVIRGARVSVHYFDIFGVQPALGRIFLAGEDEPGNDHVVLLSHVLWTNRFGADPATIGRSIVVDGEPHTVVGVLPKGGPFDRAAAQIWKPLALQASMTRDFRWLGASAKLKSGVSLETARAEMDVIGHRLETAYPASNAGWGVAVDRLDAVLISPQLRNAIIVLFAATLFVLVIGCANLASLSLARSISRRSEMAVRISLGATRWRIIQQVVVENIVIASVGGVVGVGIGYTMLLGIRSMVPPETFPPAVDVRLDTTVLLFTVATALVTGVLCSVPSAAQAHRSNLVSPLKGSGGHGRTTGSIGRRVHSALVVAEVALAFVLLVASGLLMRSFVKLLDVDPGFVAANVLTAGLPLNAQQHPSPVELNAYLASIRTAVEGVPGVRVSAMTSALPLQGWGYGVPYSIEGRPSPDATTRRPVFFKIVSPSYFDALGIKLRAGRVLRDSDAAGAPRVAVINDTLARREFHAADPIGRRISVPQIVAGRTEYGQLNAWEIVGVIADEKITALGDDTSAGLYVSNEQSPTYGISLVVRTDLPLSSLQRAIRVAIDGVNKDQPLSDVRPLADIVAQSMLGTRVTGVLLTVFATIALALAAVGIYGVISYTATQRTHEFGIRAALGASVGNVRRLIFMRGIRPASAGLAIGFLGTDPATRIMSAMVYGVGTDDPLTMGTVAALLFAVAALACYLPAWRITKADPMEALRYE